MEITYLGHSSFKLKGKEATVVTDPFDSKLVGLNFPSVMADIVVSSHDHPDHNAVSLIRGTVKRPEPFVITAPGEYEIMEVSVFGVASFHDAKQGEERGENTIYSIHMEGLQIVHLGDLGQVLTDKQVAAIGNVDVLLTPVGGFYTIGPEEALKVIEQLEPTFVVPMHYRVKGMNEDFDKLVGVEDFLRVADAEGVEAQDKLVVSEASLPEDKEIVVLKS